MDGCIIAVVYPICFKEGGEVCCCVCLALWVCVSSDPLYFLNPVSFSWNATAEGCPKDSRSFSKTWKD